MKGIKRLSNYNRFCIIVYNPHSCFKFSDLLAPFLTWEPVFSVGDFSRPWDVNSWYPVVFAILIGALLPTDTLSWLVANSWVGSFRFLGWRTFIAWLSTSEYIKWKMNVIENIVMNERCTSYKTMWQLFIFTRDALYEISSVWNRMLHKCCKLYYSFPLVLGTNFRYEPNYFQGHNNIDELVCGILQASISTLWRYISYMYMLP